MRTTLALRFSLFVTFIFLLACSSEQKIKTIYLDQYGIVPDTKENIVPKINRLIDSLGDDIKLVFKKGRYDFYPDSNYLREYFETNTYDINPKRLAILLEQKKNIQMDGKGSDFVFHEHIQPITVDACENIRIENIHIDWDFPLTAESEVLEADSSHILIKIDKEQFPYIVEEKGLKFKAENWEANWRLTGGSFLIEYNQDHIIPAFTGDHGSVRGDLNQVKYEEKAPGLVLMTGHFTKTPGIGNYLIMRHSARDHAGIFLFHSKNLELENINVYHTSGLGILSQYSENISMKKVNMIPNPDKNRYLSGHDDGLHFMGCMGQIDIDDCDALGLMDDPINIHGTCAPVLKQIDSHHLLCKFAHSMSSGLQWADPGDTLGFILKKNMRTMAKAVVKDFNRFAKDSFLISFDTSIPDYVNADYTVENLSKTPDVHIRNCFIGSCRARGYLISTPGRVVIEDNIFETSGSAILIAGDANYWYESGAVKDVSIRNNEFRTPCNSSSYQFCHAVISIFPEIPEPDPEYPFHRNIRIENNRFNPADYPVLYALSVQNLTFSNNIIERSYDFEPWHHNKNMIFLDACKSVIINNNKMGDDVLGKNIKINRMSKSDVHYTGQDMAIE